MGLIQINTDPTARQLRQFAGIFFPAFCAIVGAIVWRKTGSPAAPVAIWTVAVVIGAAGVARPAIVRPLFVGLMYGTYPIGYVISLLLLAVIFFGVVTPIGLIMRLTGRDPLHRRFDRDAATYWHPHDPGRDAGRYFRQF